MIKVSLIVPVYNVEEYLPKCLDSVLNQTSNDIEVILVNDGSPDNSEAIIKEYKNKDKRIVYLKKENGGLGSARNAGLKKAKGEYICYVDSDDWIDNCFVEKLYNKAKDNSSDIVICSFKNVYDNKEEKIEIIDKTLIEETYENRNTKIFNLVSACCKMYKRDFLLKENVMFTEEKDWYEDLAYAVKLLSKTDKISFVNEPLYNYYIRENSIMHNDKVFKNLDLIKSFDDIIDFYRNNYIYDMFYDELEFLAIDHFSFGMTRVIKSKVNSKDKKYVLNEFNKYLYKHFYNLKDNKYLYKLSNSRKLIYKLLINKKYGLVSLIFKLRGNK